MSGPPSASIEQLRSYDVALIADALDAQGLHEQVLSPTLRLLMPPPAGRFLGPARTIQLRILPPAERFQPVQPERRLAFLELLEEYIGPGDVVAIGFDQSPAPPHGVVGGMFGALYRQRGACAVVTDGYLRDLSDLRARGLAIVAAGVTPENGSGRVSKAAVGETIRVGGCSISDGDVIIGEEEGTVVVPKACLDAPLFEWLHAAAENEHVGAKAIQEGMVLSQVYKLTGRI